MTVSPTMLSLERLRDDGWMVDITERWIPRGPAGIRKDLFGLLDLVAIRDGSTLGVQTTSSSNFNARLNKARDSEHFAALESLRKAGWIVVLHGWRKSDRAGRACKHGRTRCGCRWTLHREETLCP